MYVRENYYNAQDASQVLLLINGWSGRVSLKPLHIPPQTTDYSKPKLRVIATLFVHGRHIKAVMGHLTDRHQLSLLLQFPQQLQTVHFEPPSIDRLYITPFDIYKIESYMPV